jgi:hypothetical protein
LIQNQGATPNFRQRIAAAGKTMLQQAPLPRAKLDRAPLLQAEAFPPGRHPLRQARH